MIKLIPTILLAASFVVPGFALAQSSDEGDIVSTCIRFTGGNMTLGAFDATTNGQVSVLQDFLIEKGTLVTSTGGPTGYYGRLTAIAVKKYQASRGISTTGTVGPLTKAAITAETCDGATDVGNTNTNTTNTTTSTTAPLFITSSSLPNGAVGMPYIGVVGANRGATNWSVISGMLPPGVTLNQPSYSIGINGEIPKLTSATFSGTPTAAGTYTFVVSAYDQGRSITKAFTVVVTGGITSCPVGQTLNTANVCACPAGQGFAANGTTCVDISQAFSFCPAGTAKNTTGVCVPTSVCATGQVRLYWGGCASSCPVGQTLSATPGVCTIKTCPVGQTLNSSNQCTSASSMGGPTFNFTTASYSVATGTLATINWYQMTGAVSCTASGDWSGAKAVNGGNGGSESFAINSPKHFVLTCLNSSGVATTKSFDIAITQANPNAPAITIKANGSAGPLTVGWGEDLNFTWSSNVPVIGCRPGAPFNISYARSFSPDSGTSGSMTNVEKAPTPQSYWEQHGGSQPVTGNIEGDYGMSCSYTNSYGYPEMLWDSMRIIATPVVVAPVPAPVAIVRGGTNGATIVNGSTVYTNSATGKATVLFSSQNADSCTLLNSPIASHGSLSVSQELGVSYYYYVCRNSVGVEAMTGFYVAAGSPAAASVSLSVVGGSLSVNSGSAVTFSYDTTGSTGCSLQGLDMDGTSLFAQSISSSAPVGTKTWTATKTSGFLLSCTSGASYGAVSIMVNGVPAAFNFGPSGVSVSSVLGVATACVDIPYNIHRGHESYAVTRLQEFLKAKNFLGEVTGFYGDKTVAAVKEYQATKDLPVTGMVYDFTRASIKGDSCQ